MHRIFNDVANRIIRGDFGNGDKRKENLGSLYRFVQNWINEKLGYYKRYPYW